MSLFSKLTTAKKTAAPAKSMKELYSDTAAQLSVPSGKPKDVKGAGGFAESYRVIVRPLITEKATQLGKDNQYAFVVAPDANKIMVARAVAAIYGVKPSAVRMMRVSGKRKHTGKITGRRKDWKKAMVTLPKGKSIQIYEGV